VLKLIKGDCLEVMKDLKDRTFNCIIADPPWNINYGYDRYVDSKKDADYILWSKKWFTEVKRLMQHHASFYLIMGDKYVAELKVICESLGLQISQWLIWYYTFGRARKTGFTKAHHHLLQFGILPAYPRFYSKGIRVESVRQKMGDKRACDKGKTPDDVWTFPRICGTFKERMKWHPCQLPEKLVERIILSTTREGETVLDPFAGSGTTLSVCKKLKRNCVGIELSDNYCAGIVERVGKDNIEYVH